jgi:hypothetical protein
MRVLSLLQAFTGTPPQQEGAMQILQQLTTAVPASYAEHAVAQSVELWVLLIAAGVLLVEWILSRR